MTDWLARQRRLVGDGACTSLAAARVAVIGLGGVGGAAFEALVRCGVGHILALDRDVFELTNLNRQILATLDTVGQPKALAAQARAATINLACTVTPSQVMLTPDNLDAVFSFAPDYIIDAVDNVTAKLALIEAAKTRGVPIITSMGTGNRIDAAGFVIADIERSAGNSCGLSRVMRRELKKRGVSGVTALFNTTPPLALPDGERAPASISYVPPVAGYLLAGYVARALMG